MDTSAQGDFAVAGSIEQRLLAIHNETLRRTLELTRLAQVNPVSERKEEDLPEDHPSMRGGLIETAVVHFEAGLEALAAALAFHGPLPS